MKYLLVDQVYTLDSVSYYHIMFKIKPTTFNYLIERLPKCNPTLKVEPLSRFFGRVHTVNRAQSFPVIASGFRPSQTLWYGTNRAL